MTRRDRIALTVVVSVAALLAYWFLLLGPKREEAVKTQQQIETAQQRLDTAQRLLSASQQAKATYAANYTAVSRLGKAVPPSDDLPSLLYQLDSTSKGTGVDFREIKLNTANQAGAFPASAGAAPAPGQAAPAQPQSGQGAQPAQPGQNGQAQPAQGQQAASDEGGAQPANGQAQGQNAQQAAPPAPGTAANPAAPTQAVTATLPPGAVVGPAGLATMPFHFRFQGSFAQLANFFGAVQRYNRAQEGRIAVSGRLITFNGVAVTFSEMGYPKMNGLISATTYILPASEGLVNGATPTAPSQTGATPVANPAGGAATPPAAATP